MIQDTVEKNGTAEGHTGLIRFIAALYSGLYFVCYQNSVIPIYLINSLKLGDTTKSLSIPFF